MTSERMASLHRVGGVEPGTIVGFLPYAVLTG